MLDKLNVRQLRTRAISVSSPRISHRSNSVPIDKLLGENQTPDLVFMTPNNMVMYISHNVSSHVDTDQGEGIRNQLIYVAKQMIGFVSRHTHFQKRGLVSYLHL